MCLPCSCARESLKIDVINGSGPNCLLTPGWPQNIRAVSQSTAWPQGVNSPLGESLLFSFMRHAFINQPHTVRSCCLSGTIMVAGNLFMKPWVSRVTCQKGKTREDRVISHTTCTGSATPSFGVSLLKKSTPVDPTAMLIFKSGYSWCRTQIGPFSINSYLFMSERTHSTTCERTLTTPLTPPLQLPYTRHLCFQEFPTPPAVLLISALTPILMPFFLHLSWFCSSVTLQFPKTSTIDVYDINTSPVFLLHVASTHVAAHI